jgi:hypothetical protein
MCVGTRQKQQRRRRAVEGVCLNTNDLNRPAFDQMDMAAQGILIEVVDEINRHLFQDFQWAWCPV